MTQFYVSYLTGTQRSLCPTLGHNRDSFHTQKTGNGNHATKEKKRYTGCLRGKPKLREKPRQPTGCKLSLCWNVQNSEFTEATTLYSRSSPQAAVTTEAMTSFSLSLSLFVHYYVFSLLLAPTRKNDNNHTKVCPKSYLY